MATEGIERYGDAMVRIDKDDRPSFRCRAKDILTAIVKDDKNEGWVVVLTIAREGIATQTTIPCEDEDEAGRVLGYVASRMENA